MNLMKMKTIFSSGFSDREDKMIRCKI